MKLKSILMAMIVCGLGSTAVAEFSMVDSADSQKSWAEKPDFADVERNTPNKWEDLKKITMEELKGYSQEQLDQLYSVLTPGPIPNGAYDGAILITPDGPMKNLIELAKVVKLNGILSMLGDQKLELLGEMMWSGKYFNNKTRVLQNRINLGLELRWFPAKLFCGQSKFDSRREAVIIDYAYNDTIKGVDPNTKKPYYLEGRDDLVGRHGLQIRDEIRMIRPGFYLGRAYFGKLFVLNFALHNKDAVSQSGPWKEDCWTGEQELGIQRPSYYSASK
jgi:hypothetical protein